MNNKLEKYLNRNKTSSFRDLLFSFIDKKGFTDAEVYKKVFIDRRLFSKIRCNENYVPRKENIIKLCLALSLNKDEVKTLVSVIAERFGVDIKSYKKALEMVDEKFQYRRKTDKEVILFYGTEEPRTKRKPMRQCCG